jgi:hypothetical protein
VLLQLEVEEMPQMFLHIEAEEIYPMCGCVMYVTLINQNEEKIAV